MGSEVGPFFDPNKQETILGLCDNKANRRACGYVNDPTDTGGETKFGIAKNSHPALDIRALTLAKAIEIYYNEYWLAGKCDKMPGVIGLLHFDTCVNMGVGAAAKLLQIALGITADGDIGPGTMTAISQIKDQQGVCVKYLDAKQKRYDSIILKNPSQAKFAAGWKNRNDAMRAFTKTIK